MKRFELKSEHIKLLRAAYVDWDDCEYGAPAINCKRPYGSSAVESSIAEVLGYDKPCYECGRGWPPDVDLRALHEETRTALQIILRTGSFTPGVYEAPDYTQNWRMVATADA